MTAPGISFVQVRPQVAADPNRMDIALFVGFLPLRAGAAALAARAAVATELARSGWAARVAGSGDTLTDLPVRVRSVEEAERLFDTSGRLDRAVMITGQPLGGGLTITPAHAVFGLSLDGVERHLTLPVGPIDRAALRALLSDGLPDLAVTLGPVTGGRASLILTVDGQRRLTVYANPDLGFPVAVRNANRSLGAPMGVALRSFFAAGGREAVVVRMGDPVPLFALETDRVQALAALIGGGYGAGATSLADLMPQPPPALPPDMPSRDPWHGLAHLHELQDVTLVLMPDLPDLVATLPASLPPEPPLPRPAEVFTVCAPEPFLPENGQMATARPAATDATGLDLWSRLVGWAVTEIARLSPELMLLAALPHTDPDSDGVSATALALLPETGNGGAGLAHPQLQIIAPWVRTPEARDLPGAAAPADGLLAGHIARRTLADGAWRTVAGTRLSPGQVPYGARPGLSPDHVPGFSHLGRIADAGVILSDRTTDPGACAQANIRRLIALIFRAARHRGEAAVFSPNGPAFWRDVAMPIITLLRQLHSAGALRGATEDEAFSVLCGPRTTSQSDMDQGRAIAEITIAPAHSIEQIEVSLIAAGTAPRLAGDAA